MSLINRIINDLEDRQALTTENKGRIFQGLSSADILNHKKNILTVNLFTVFLFLVASVSGTYAFMEQRAGRILEDIAIKEKVDTPMDLLEPITGDSENIISQHGSDEANTRLEENPLKLDFSLSSYNIPESGSEIEELSAVGQNTTRIKAIRLSENDNNLLLNLDLTSAADYRAYALASPDRIIVEIDDAVLDGVIPDLTFQSGVSNIRIRQDHVGKLLLVLDTTDAYSIEKTALIPSAKGYALNLLMISAETPGPDVIDPLPEVQAKTKKPSSSVIAEYGDMQKNVSSNNELSQAGRMYLDARELYRIGKIQQANDLLTALLKKYMAHKAARTLLAQKLIEQGQLQKAELLLKAGLTTQGSDSSWANLYARLLVNKGDVDTAIRVLTSATPEVNSEPDYYAFLAALYQKSGRHTDAVLTYRQVLQLKPDNSVWWMGLAISLELLQKNNEALFAYNKALQGNLMSQDLLNYVQSKINTLNKRG